MESGRTPALPRTAVRKPRSSVTSPGPGTGIWDETGALTVRGSDLSGLRDPFIAATTLNNPCVPRFSDAEGLGRNVELVHQGEAREGELHAPCLLQGDSHVLDEMLDVEAGAKSPFAIRLPRLFRDHEAAAPLPMMSITASMPSPAVFAYRSDSTSRSWSP